MLQLITLEYFFKNSQKYERKITAVVESPPVIAKRQPKLAMGEMRFPVAIKSRRPRD